MGGCRKIQYYRDTHFLENICPGGLRVGYGISAPAVTEQVNIFNSIDNTNIAGAVSALASLNDKPFIDYSRHSTDVSREIVVAALKELNLPYAPSQANFIFHKVTGDVKPISSG